MLVILSKHRDCGFSVVLLLKEKVICFAVMTHIFLSASQRLSWWQLPVPSKRFYHIDDVCEEKIFSKIKDRFSGQKKEDNKLPRTYGLKKILIIENYRG